MRTVVTLSSFYSVIARSALALCDEATPDTIDFIGNNIHAPSRRFLSSKQCA